MRQPVPLDDERLPQILGVVQRDGEVDLDIFIPDSLFYLRGHFPTYPILPGVVQVDWALHFGRDYLSVGAGSSAVIQVKFRRPIRPLERIRLRLMHAEAQRRLSFDYSNNQGQCSLGQITLVSL